jgi:hypothetical protein
MISVTEALSVFTDFKYVNPDILERSSERGSYVHDYINRHHSKSDLDWNGLGHETIGYISSFLEFKNSVIKSWIGSEIELFCNCKFAPFVGHLDAVVELETGKYIIDWKTPKAQSKTWRIQLAGYKHLAEDNENTTYKRAVVMLDENGGAPRFVEYPEKDYERDFAVFISALNCYRYFKK